MMLRNNGDSTDQVIHPFAPVYGPDSRILILGTMPSRVSRQQGYYYGHPQNRFWQVLAELFQVPVPKIQADREKLLLDHQIALWDVLQQCRISGSSDSSIRVPVPNDLIWLLGKCPIQRIFTNGQTAARLYRTWCEPHTLFPCVGLPSTSPANGRYSKEMLCAAWRQILDF